MAKASKIVKCVDCGQGFPRTELNRNFRCSECAWPKAANVMSQLHQKSGPEYEKWRKAMKNAARRL